MSEPLPHEPVSYSFLECFGGDFSLWRGWDEVLANAGSAPLTEVFVRLANGQLIIVRPKVKP